MPPPSAPLAIEWRLHLTSSPEAVFDFWATDEGRKQFWAERSRDSRSGFSLEFVNGETIDVEIVESRRPEQFAFRYFGGSRVTVSLTGDGAGGCDLHLAEEQLDRAEQSENRAGWVSVLMALKAAADFGVDLRGHDPTRSWDQLYVEN